MTTFKLGRLPNDPTKARLKLSAFLTSTAPTYPENRDWISAVANYPMFGNDTIGDCVTPETLILTESLEWVAAGSLQVGDSLLGFDEDSKNANRVGRNQGRWFRTSTVEKADIVQRPCYELEFEDGTVVCSSSGHRWLTRSTVQGKLGCQEWVRTEDLRVESPRQSRLVKPLETWDIDVSWHAGYLAAAFDGEGHLEQVRRANRVAFNQTANDMLDQVELSLKELGFDYHHEVHNRNKLLRVDGAPRKEMHTLRIGNRRDFLNFMGSVRPRRLLSKYNVESLGRIPDETVALVRKTFVGEQDVVMLDTSSRTYFANGLASHNCTCATVGHIIQSLSTYGAGATQTITLDDVIKAYSAVSGYDPKTGRNDNGAVVQDVLNYWRKNGVGGHKILAFAEVDYRNKDELFAAMNMFGTIYLGINFPNTAMDQFNEGKPWDYVPGAYNEGGHAINAAYYDVSDKMWKVVTWGRVQPMTQAFWDHYVKEAWVVITKEWFNAQGDSPTGLDMHALGEQFANMTHEENPFPDPDPVDPPVDPTPEPDPADLALRAAAEAWFARNPWFYKKAIQKPLKDWLKAKFDE